MRNNSFEFRKVFTNTNTTITGHNNSFQTLDLKRILLILLYKSFRKHLLKYFTRLDKVQNLITLTSLRGSRTTQYTHNKSLKRAYFELQYIDAAQYIMLKSCRESVRCLI